MVIKITSFSLSHFLSRWKSHTIKPAHLECLVQWVSVESQPYATITISPELDKLFSLFLAAPHDLWDLSFLTNDLNPGSLLWQWILFFFFLIEDGFFFFQVYFIFNFYFLAAPHSMWDPRPPTRDRTCEPCIGSTKPWKSQQVDS